MVSSYYIKRASLLIATLIVAIYASVIAANGGGLIDDILKAQIREDIQGSLRRNPDFNRLPAEEQKRIIDERVELAIKAKGLDRPFVERSLIYLIDALRLDLGRAMFTSSASGSRQVYIIILERLPQTVLLFTTATIIITIIGLAIGLVMARKPGRLFDKFMMLFAVITNVIPGWFLGIIFILIFAYYLRVAPFGGMFSVPPPEDPLLYALDFLWHLALPLFTWVFISFGGWAYVVRNMVVQVSEEDFVVAAKAKGLPEKMIRNRYVLRPSLPPIVTIVALSLIGSWSGAVITETVFNWPGIGSLLNWAIGVTDIPVIMGVVVIYAYLLVATVFILDMIYGFLDPRIRAKR